VKQKDHRTKSECKAHLEIFIATIEAIHTTQHKSKNPSKLLGPTKITFPLERKQSLVAGLLIIIIRLLLLLGGGGSAAGGAAPAEVRRQVLHLHLDHVLPHPDVGDVPAGAVDPGGDGRHAERPRRDEPEGRGEERGEGHADGGRGLAAPADAAAGGGEEEEGGPAVEREVLAVVLEQVVVAEVVPQQVHRAAHGGAGRVGARGGARAAAQPGEERRGRDAVLEALRRAAAQEAVQAGEHHAALRQLEAAVREGRALVGGALLREEEAGRRDGRVQPGCRPCLLLPCEVHHLAPADVNSCTWVYC
jgi:hypothetical protein